MKLTTRKEHYRKLWEREKDLLIVWLVVFVALVPGLTFGQARDFSWFDFFAGLYFVTYLFRMAIKASEIEEEYRANNVDQQGRAYGCVFEIGKTYLHLKSGGIYTLLSISNHSNTVDFPATAIYENNKGEVFTRDLFEFSQKFRRYGQSEDDE